MSISKKRLIRTVVLDVVLFGVLAFIVAARVFGLFGLFGSKADDTPAVTLATPPPTQAPTEAPTQEPADTAAAVVPEDPTPEPVITPEPVAGLCGDRFPGKFTTGDVVTTDTTYQSKNVDITVTPYDANGVRYQIADIYIQDIQCLQTYGAWMGTDTEHTPQMAKDAGAILAVNGDYYLNAKYREHGWFVRNGQELARYDFATYTSDICVLYYDGSMEVIPIDEVTAVDYDAIIAKYPYQIWYFGPSLLTADGGIPTHYNSTLMTYNPRTAIGYYEPGHYCMLTVEGARGGNNDSKGMTIEEMSQLFSQLGCKLAFNLDGGASSAMFFSGATFGNDGRGTSDIVLIKDLTGGEA